MAAAERFSTRTPGLEVKRTAGGPAMKKELRRSARKNCTTNLMTNIAGKKQPAKLAKENEMDNRNKYDMCATCGKDCPTPFAIDVGNGHRYCSPACYTQSLLNKEPKITDYEYPDNRRDEFPYNDEGGC